MSVCLRGKGRVRRTRRWNSSTAYDLLMPLRQAFSVARIVSWHQRSDGDPRWTGNDREKGSVHDDNLIHSLAVQMLGLAWETSKGLEAGVWTKE